MRVVWCSDATVLQRGPENPCRETSCGMAIERIPRVRNNRRGGQTVVRNWMRFGIAAGVILATSACGGRFSGPFSGGRDDGQLGPSENALRQREALPDTVTGDRETIWDLFTGADNPNTTLEVNKYIWNATLDVLDFLPVQAADPFSGVLVFGYGTPPGGGRAYRATVYVQDPALDARSLRVALASRSGAVPLATVRAVEDAILTRARQLRIRDGDL